MNSQAPHPLPPPVLFDGLNPVQREAVETTEGPVLILAGAGTGKTRVLTTRLAHILGTHKALPGQMLAVTFTNKAAQEMKSRVSRLLGNAPVEGWWLGTFHSLCARMLRRHADLIGLTSQFTIIDQDDQLRLIKQLAEAENIDTKKWPAKLLAEMIERWKDRGLRPSDLSIGDGGDVAGGKMTALYALYQQRLKTINACDFGDLLLHMITIFRDAAHNDVLAEYHRRFRYILVDEYQDTNVAQYLWLRLLAQGAGNICCVGDDDQSIYGWRGAEVGNILRFEKDFPSAKIIRLEQNYRSTGHILGAAGGVIAHNKGRLGKTLWSESGAGEKVSLRGFWDGESEAHAVCEEMDRLKRQGWSYRQMAVLVRAGFQMREFEERFIQLHLPYRVFGGPRFYERQEIRDALAYFRVMLQPSDDLAFERIVNVPKRGLGDATLQTIHVLARRLGVPLTSAAQHLCESDELKPKARGALQTLLRDFDRWRSLLSTTDHGALAGQILDESGYSAMWQADKAPDAPGRLENLKELVAGMEEFESFAAFLEHVALVLETQDVADGDEFVSLMTLHGAKGLEFDAVFLPGWEDGLFPSQRTMDENGLAGLEEERRLAYVGITRAKRRAYISYAANRRMYGSWVQAIPSRFIEELPEEHIAIPAERESVPVPRSYGTALSYGFSSNPSRPSVSIAAQKTAGSSGPTFCAGTHIQHEKFGKGKVVHVAGHKLDIQFEDGSVKCVIDSFVTKIDS
jgi:DNA helicase-2/ATP-dependent DNA helicase PcrA